MNPKPWTFSRRVEFRDTDAAGIAHFTALFAYMEEAEHAFLRHLGLSVHQRDKQGETISWPRVAAQCDFQQPVKFEDVVEIAVSIEKLGGASVVYRFELSQAGRAVAQGTMTSVCCQIRAGQPPRAIPIPEPIRQKLACHLAAREA